MSCAASSLRMRSAQSTCARRAAFPLLVRRVALPGRLPLRQAASPAGGPEPQASSTSTPAEPEVPTNLTTWQYSKLADPGFAPWFLAMCFLPFVLLLVPMLSSPPMPPLPPPAP
ncbi:hypothetical protein CHLRE_06g287200v5 [Chlamydomonas reinhardtii]|uniref:Uncharacterized protein n=1 Tax=Chlamydomonas reinhardtii TaxID=3055 RepID=A8J2C3_CHLRE|nr:uncharacterized protein CHLRE_06g287200v5 [Chlamydomonas reinhardtii]XP_042924066.1 uncharacterized protein CHLRE_06g287200v5 [Chlamydomonas reinhardtii]PNW82635.1 hypothetical protein CHLRE_06g287200v5 [Chlamydomonas reinhardtii]PNW82636.1 hypothetical protein CHLRE_06g287200v5 [Chlamydomonas reinhardtii]|eukprot:XP_001695497.1 predicted protein [Chlamydomonas reinhardtii]